MENENFNNSYNEQPQNNETPYSYNNNTYNHEYTPYVNRPGQSGAPLPTRPPRIRPNAFAKASLILGIIAVVSVFTFTVYPAMILGSLSIILALLSKGALKKMHENARIGVITGIIALGINLFLIIGSCYVVFTIPEYREQFDEMYENMYGESFDDTLERIQNGTYED